jgi:hypothetical protein
VNASSAPGNNRRRHKPRQKSQPKAGRFRLTVAKLPGLDSLRAWAEVAGQDRHRLLKTHARDRCAPQRNGELYRRLLPAVGALGREVPGAADGKVSTWRMTNHHIPPAVELGHNVAPDVVGVAIVGRLKVA